jgi:peptidoglycan hydrolase-like protein with peptidoglycan-binding domain
MRLRHLVIATSAVFSAGALAAAGEYGAQERQSQGQQAPGMSQSQGKQAPGMSQSQGERGAQQQQARSPEVVKKVQQELKQQGFDAGPVDGQWGPLTQQGVKKFQESKDLKATGQLDQQTLSALGIQEESSATGGSAAGGSAAGGSGTGGSAGSKAGSQAGGSEAGSPGSQPRP